MRSRTDFNEQILFDHVVPAAAKEEAGRAVYHNVVAGGDTGSLVVWINRPVAVVETLSQKSEPIILYDSAMKCPVSAAVDGAGGGGIQANLFDAVKLNEVIVTAKTDGLMWRVMDIIVIDPLPDASQTHSWLVRPHESRVVTANPPRLPRAYCVRLEPGRHG